MDGKGGIRGVLEEKKAVDGEQRERVTLLSGREVRERHLRLGRVSRARM